MLEESTLRNAAFRQADLPKYSAPADHPFRMSIQDDGKIGFSPGVVRPSLSYGMPGFVPTFYGEQLRNPITGQLTARPMEAGRYYIETTGMWATLAAIEPRNLRVFIPTAGDIKHETDVAFGDPNKKLVQIGSIGANRLVNQLLRSDLTMADLSDVPYTGVPGVGPYDPSIWGEWPTGSGGLPVYGGGNPAAEGNPYGDYLFDYGE